MATSRLASAAPEIEELSFHSFPQSKHVMQYAKAASAHGVKVAVDAKGKIYSTEVHGNYYLVRGDGLRATLKCCVALGLITQDQYNLHDSERALSKKLREKRMEAEELERVAKNFGVALTKPQLAKIEKAKQACNGGVI